MDHSRRSPRKKQKSPSRATSTRIVRVTTHYDVHNDEHPTMSTLTLRIADDLKEQLDALAEATGRTKSFLAVAAIRAYLQQEAWQIAEIRQALQEADAGDFASDAEVRDVRERWSMNDAG